MKLTAQSGLLKVYISYVAIICKRVHLKDRGIVEWGTKKEECHARKLLKKIDVHQQVIYVLRLWFINKLLYTKTHYMLQNYFCNKAVENKDLL